VGIKPVQRVHEENSLLSYQEQEVSRRDTYRVSEHSVGSAKCASSRKNARRA
jgi:hypothetical protein